MLYIYTESLVIMGKTVPLPAYIVSIIGTLLQQPSYDPFIQRLMHELRHFLQQHFGKHMTQKQFKQVFTGAFIADFIKATGIDIVGYAHRIMKHENLALGEFPLTWTEAIAEGVQHMSRIWYSIRMTPDEFDILYPRELFVKYTIDNGFDKLV